MTCQADGRSFASPKMRSVFSCCDAARFYTTVAYGSILARGGEDSHSARCPYCAAIAQTALPVQSEQRPESSPDVVVESLERSLSEGQNEKAHDLLISDLET